MSKLKQFFMLSFFALIGLTLFTPYKTVEASTIFYLPYESTAGNVRVNRTGLLYKPDYDAAGLSTTYYNCNSTSYCYGANGEYHDYSDGFSFDRGAIDFSLPTGTHILAAAGGTTTADTNSCQVVIQHADGTKAYYLHASAVYVSPGQTITRGQHIANVGSSCGADGPHLHFAVWSGSHEIRVTFADVSAQAHGGILRPSRTGFVEYRYSSSNGVSEPPVNQNLVRNGTFGNGVTYWQFWGEISHAVYNNVLHFHRAATSPNGAAIYQDMGYSVPTNKSFEITVKLGNSSGVVKRPHIFMRDSNSWNDYFSCQFTIQPYTPLQTYTIRGRTNTNWNNIHIEVWPDPPDGVPDVTMDDVSVMYRPDLNVSTTQCIAPTQSTPTPAPTNTPLPTSTPMPTATPQPSPTVPPNVQPGDCNTDQNVNAADVTALTLEIFDGDGTNPNNATGGTFMGGPGCDSNTDISIDAADLSCTILIIFNGPGICSIGQP